MNFVRSGLLTSGFASINLLSSDELLASESRYRNLKMNYKYCVVVPFHPDFISISDLRNIGSAIRLKDPTLLLKPTDRSSATERQEFRLPTLPAIFLQFHSFKSDPLPEFTGPRLKTQPVHKAQQLRMLDAAGIRAPKWARLDPDTEIDSAEFGEFLIIKPTEKLSSLGRGITLIRTSEFETYRDRFAPEFKSSGRSPPIVQQYIRTGGMPEHFRVLTLLGRIVSCRRSTQAAITPIHAPMTNLVLDEKVASNAGELIREVYKDSEIEEFALRIESVFDSAVQGIDILRSSDDGELYALEINMGDVWAFSSRLGVKTRTLIGVETMRQQYDLFETSADVIIENARRLLDLS